MLRKISVLTITFYYDDDDGDFVDAAVDYGNEYFDDFDEQWWYRHGDNIDEDEDGDDTYEYDDDDDDDDDDDVYTNDDDGDDDDANTDDDTDDDERDNDDN